MRHFAEVARRRLAGEDNTGQRIVRRRPQEWVVLGVMPPRPRHDQPPLAPQVSDLPEEPGYRSTSYRHPKWDCRASLSRKMTRCASRLMRTSPCIFSTFLPTVSKRTSHKRRQWSWTRSLPSETRSPPIPASRAAAGSVRARRGPSDRVQAVYVRFDVATPVEFTLQIPAQGDTAPHTVTQSLELR